MFNGLRGRVAALATGLVLGTPLSADAPPLRAYAWKYRPLLVFAPSARHAALKQQRVIIATHASGFKDRDVVVIEIVADQVRSTFGPKPRASASALRDRYGINENVFRVVLVGKDGGQKLMQKEAASAPALFGLIDAMPMRRQEMRPGG